MSLFNRETPSPRAGTKPRRTGSKDTPPSKWVSPRKTGDGSFNHTNPTKWVTPKESGNYQDPGVPPRVQPTQKVGRPTPKHKAWNLKEVK